MGRARAVVQQREISNVYSSSLEPIEFVIMASSLSCAHRTTATTTKTTATSSHYYNRVKTRHKLLNSRKMSPNYYINPTKCFLLVCLLIHLLAHHKSMAAIVNSSEQPTFKATESVRYTRSTLTNNNNNNNANINSNSNNNNNNINSNNNDLTTNQALQQQQQQQPPAIPSTYVKLSNNASSANVRAQYNYNSGHYARFNNHSISESSLSSSSRFEDNQSSQKRGLFEKICIGTSNRMSAQSNKTDHYQNLVERYKNCTYVIGNLEITWLERGPSNKPPDLTFLESIREITGYLLIAYVEVEKISMPNLQIIRGRDLFKLNVAKDEYALLVIENELKSLELPNLREILAGDVSFRNNRNLCYIDTINWEEIQNPSFGPMYFIDRTRYSPPECPKCHESCPDSCWGPGPEMCQKFSKTNCSPQCEKGRCFGPAPRECCHLFCAGGCTGPKQTDCLACKNFYNDGECIQECPPMRKYNPSRFLWETDPNGKYAFGATCVKECPEHLLRDNGACVRSCPQDKRSQNGECVSCGGPCPKNCQGVDVVNSKNIDQLINCTEIEGSITILDTSFSGYTELNSNNTMGARYEPMHPSRLVVFETIRNITGYLNIQAAHPDFKNLSFFSKLEIIGGRQTTDMFHSLSIIKTSLTSLNFRSLKRVKSGKIVIEENKDLCFANTSQFVKLGIAKEDDITIRNNGDERKCRVNGLKCHEQCSLGGCWGPGPDECLSCNRYKLDDYCVNNCTSTQSIGILSFDSGVRVCSRCHPECKGGCSERTARNCYQCKNLKDGPYCVTECPGHKYNDNGICQECNKNCVDGCTGPSSQLGAGGCNSCGKIIIDSLHPNLIAHCIKAEEHCPDGYYQEYGAPVSDNHPLKKLERKPLCRRCHSRCKSCTGFGTHKDVCECAGYVANDQCEESCPRDFYADEKSRRCMKCSRECNGCFGSTEADCLNCRVYRIYQETPSGPIASARVSEKTQLSLLRQQGRFNCTAQCPSDKPHRIVESNLLDPYCSEEPAPDSDSVHVMFIGSTSIMSVIVLAAIMLCAFVYKCQIDKARTVKRLTMRLSGLDDVEPLNKSNITPNLQQLKNIKETELKQGRKLGEGFGGVVHHGLWTPEGQKDPRPVAIKILKDNKNKEFLEEAYIMASVNHPNLVKLLGVCMTCNDCMLITQLVPLGCLLDYVQKHRFNIGSKFLLEWSRQIACGMAYLEEHRMVHRDLALRNVLLQTSNKVLISDFGLAKLLEADQSEYHSGGGRLPIKWLAPECIRERKFTHKSDVWAFGVTIWELLTFGEPPFENYETKDVPSQIENGARLPQPPYVSAEVYKVMMSCWFYKPEFRPNFKSLREEFAKFKNQHTKYLGASPPGEAPTNELSNREEYQDSDSQDDEPSPTSLMDFQDSDQHQRFDESELKHFHSESETPNGHLSTPTSRKSIGMFLDTNVQHQMSEDVFMRTSQQISSKGSNSTVMITDSNNNFIGSNNNIRLQANSFLSVNQATSTNSMGQKSEQPTDDNDYLIPSPCSNVAKFEKFVACREGQQSSKQPPPPQPSPRDPPHSAGLIGIRTSSITNYEYFYNMNRSNYANSGGPHGGATNASSGHIPQSLV